MADIKVEFQRLDDFSVKQKKMSSKAAEIGQKLNSLKGSLDWDIAGSSGIDRRIFEVCRDIESYRQSLSNMSDYLINASKEYKQCENELAEGGNKDIWNDILRAGIGGIGGIAIYEIAKVIENIFGINHQNADAKPSPVQNTDEVPSTPAAQTPPLSGTLSYNPGQYSKEVEEMQKRLNELGYKGKDGKPLDVDGKFGVNTLKAVNDFKMNNHLGNTGEYEGKIGSTSWPVLFSAGAITASAGNMNGSVSNSGGGNTSTKGTSNVKLNNYEADLVSQINWIDPKFDKELNNFKKIYEDHKEVYEQISEKTGIPPELIASIHYRESNCNFNTYLHNGDPLGKPTTNYPAGKNFNNFTDAAVDALLDKKYLRNQFNLNSDSNDVSAMMAFAESYNGLGYKEYHDMASPYVYSGTNVYQIGKYVSDGHFNPNVKDAQPGVYILMNKLKS